MLRPTPKSIQSAITEELVEIQQDQQPDFFIAEVGRSYVVPDPGAAMTEDRCVFLESMDMPSHFRLISRRWWWSEVRHLQGRYMIPYSTWAQSNYYHWMVECLPRIMPILEHDWDDVSIIVPTGFPDYMQESLRLLGIPENRIVTTACERQLQVEQLVLVSRAGAPHQAPRWALRWVAEQLIGATGATGGGRKRRLYISRAQSSKRRIRNEVEVETLLSSYGFETVQPENLSLAEQVALFRDAEVVVAPHGAGNTNIIFADSLLLIEIFPTTYGFGRGCYYSICDELGFPYWYLIGDLVGEDDMCVNLEDLKQTLNIAMQSIK